jgi:hypothetical protein
MMMKFTGYTLAVLGWMSPVAEARYIGPLLVKEASTGFVMPEDSKTEKCEVFAQKTVFTTNFGGIGGLKSVLTRNQILDGDYMTLIQNARKQKLVNQPGAVDGPTVRYYAWMINPDDSVSRVTLYDENGGTGLILSNRSAEARVLKNVLDSMCPGMLEGIGPAPVP